MLFPSFSDRGKAQAQLWCCSYLELPGLLCVLCSGEYLRSTVTAISTDHNSRRSRDALSALLYNGLYNNQENRLDNMNEITIKALSPDLEKDYFDFFDNRAFSDGSPYYPCYCNAFNMSAGEIEAMRDQAKQYGGGIEGWKRSLRETAVRMVRQGLIRGYLAFDNDLAVGWCNANDRTNYYRVGEFDLDHLPDESTYSHSCLPGQVLSIVCFEISPDYRGKGIAKQLLKQICSDAARNGYQYVEAYPEVSGQTSMAFTGPVKLYEKNGFAEFKNDGKTIIMRKHLN